MSGRIVTIALACMIAAACGTSQPRAPEREEVVYDEHGEPAGLHRYRRWSEKIGQGAQPEGEIAFQNLAALGYTTILSVDGSVPDVEGAAKYGLRYVHVPIGYDGIQHEQGLRIVKAVEISEGPVYVHCHHGKHRGPAAAMAARICVDGISKEEAVRGLELSETSPNYKGLWRDVEAFEAPSPAELAQVPDDLPSKVLPGGVRASMVQVSVRWELIQACRAADWKTPRGHPDVDPPHEARMLWELYREMARLEDARALGESFLAFAKAGEDAGQDLEEALRAGKTADAEETYRMLKKNCDACHGEYRN